MSVSAEHVCDGLEVGGRGCWLLWIGAPAVTATVPPFQLCTAELREGPDRVLFTFGVDGEHSPFAEPEMAAPPTTG
jgi:hypothetical protein